MAEPVVSAPAPVIVLIEDEPQIRRFLRATLGTQGYRLHEATSGEDGLIETSLGTYDADEYARQLAEVHRPDQ